MGQQIFGMAPEIEGPRPRKKYVASVHYPKAPNLPIEKHTNIFSKEVNKLLCNYLILKFYIGEIVCGTRIIFTCLTHLKLID